MKENHSESLMIETLNSVQKPTDDLPLMALPADPQNSTTENQENQSVNHFNSETSTTAQQYYEKSTIDNIKQEEQPKEDSYIKSFFQLSF
ncbi:hypothetical protein BGP_4822 [Beggiatoa sp. PS]|nr:hypothetical protein BGP_4822 [Beggiatoa sp. PS]